MLAAGPESISDATFIPLGIANLVLLVVKWLAVIGAAAVGAIGSGILLGVITRVARRGKKAPRLMRLPVQLLGAVALGLATWKLFGLGDLGGPGMGSGDGLGLGGPPSQPQPNTGTNGKIGKTPEKPDGLREKKPEEDQVVRIEMLGGRRVQQERFYLLAGQTEPLTLAEVCRELQRRLDQRDRPSLRRVEIVIHETSVAQSHPAVRELEQWIRQNGLGVTLIVPQVN